jgi:hypothetical protein
MIKNPNELLKISNKMQMFNIKQKQVLLREWKLVKEQILKHSSIGNNFIPSTIEQGLKMYDIDILPRDIIMDNGELNKDCMNKEG